MDFNVNLHVSNLSLSLDAAKPPSVIVLKLEGSLRDNKIIIIIFLKQLLQSLFFFLCENAEPFTERDKSDATVFPNCHTAIGTLSIMQSRGPAPTNGVVS